MDYHVAVNHEQAIIDVLISGEGQSAKIIEMYSQVSEKAHKHQINKVLVDARALSFAVTDPVAILKNFEVISKLLAGLKVARIVTLNDYKQDLVETIAQKSFSSIQNFSTKEEALSWLTFK